MADLLMRMRSIRGTTAEWAADDIVLGDGEIAVEILSQTEVKLKVGDGIRKFSALPYASGALKPDQILAIDSIANGTVVPHPIVLPGGPGLDEHAANKKYVDDGDALHVLKAGDTMTGPLILPTPTADSQAATKKYVDDVAAVEVSSRSAGDALAVKKAGDTMSGPLVLSGAPTLDPQAANKKYVDDLAALKVAIADLVKIGGTGAQANKVPQLSADGKLDTSLLKLPQVINLKGTIDPTGSVPANPQLGDLYLAHNGGTLSAGYGIVPAPTVGTGDMIVRETSTAWVVLGASADLLQKVGKAGDTMSGPLYLSGAPTVDLQASTKKYVDDTVAAEGAARTAADGLNVKKAGDTMSGPLVLPGAPTTDLQASTKKYVDDAHALAVKKAGDSMSGLLTLSGDPTSDMHASTKKYVDDMTALEAISRTTGDALNVKKAGDTMAGPLTLPGAPTADLQAATKKYVDDAVIAEANTRTNEAALVVKKAGDTMSGPLVLSGAPTADLQASTKKYVDDKVAAIPVIDLSPLVRKAGDTMTGPLVLSAAPTGDLQASTKKYVDDTVATEAAARTAADALNVKKAGDTMSGPLVLPGAPTADLQASTKKYVDDTVATEAAARAAADALSVQKSGDTMTGPLVLPGAPTLDLQAATKKYVDDADALKIDKADLRKIGGTTAHVDKIPQLSADGKIDTSMLKLPSIMTLKGTIDPTKTAPGAPNVGDLYIALTDGTLSAGYGISPAPFVGHGDFIIRDTATTWAVIGTTADLAQKVSKAGDVMTGPLVLPGTPTADPHATPKKYVDDTVAAEAAARAAADSLQVLKAGDTMTGPLVLSGAPVVDAQAANKKYVDDKIAAIPAVDLTSRVSKTGDTMSGPLVLPGAPTLDLQAATKKYVDDAQAGAVKKAGDTMSGPLVLSGAPVFDLHASTKKYVDDRIAGIPLPDLTSRVSKAGDAMTGPLVLSGAPTADLEASTKKYVDDKIAAIPVSAPVDLSTLVKKAGDTMTGDLTFTGAGANIDKLGNDPLILSTNTSPKITIAPNGCIGLGVTPSSWGMGMGGIDLRDTAYVSAGTSALSLSTNAYNNSGWKYKGTGTAMEYSQRQGTFSWKTAARGMPGGTVTWTETMRLQNTGNFFVDSGTALGPKGGRITLYPGDGVNLISSEVSGAFGTHPLDIIAASVKINIGTGNPCLALDPSGNLAVKGTVTGNVTLSDRSLKENLEPLKDAVNIVQQLNGYRFNYIGKPEKMVGVVAQELEQVLPELVYETHRIDTQEKVKAVHYGNITAVLIEAVKEQQALIQSLTDRIAALEGKA